MFRFIRNFATAAIWLLMACIGFSALGHLIVEVKDIVPYIQSVIDIDPLMTWAITSLVGSMVGALGWALVHQGEK